MSDKGIDFVGDEGANSYSYNTQPSASPMGSGPIKFVGDGMEDCHGTLETKDGSQSGSSSGPINFVG